MILHFVKKCIQFTLKVYRLLSFADVIITSSKMLLPKLSLCDTKNRQLSKIFCKLEKLE